MDKKLLLVLYCLFAAMSIVLFFMMGSDKRRAKKGARRIPEKRLFAFALLGGGIGGWLGMLAFRHKTKHWYFKFGFPIIALAQIALCVWLSLR